MSEAEAGQRERVWPTIFAAYRDMLAALDWVAVEGFTGRKLVLGSSVSAILVLKLPQDRRVDAVLSFSPGEYYESDSTMVQTWAQSLRTPTLIVAAPGEEEMSRPIYDAIATDRKTFHSATGGRHGASILLEDSGNWDGVRSFLRAFKGPQEVAFTAEDGVTVYGDLYETAAPPSEAPVILLLHQGGANARGEYEPLADRLLAAGFTLLAIDQRRGGGRLGSTNRTVEALTSDQASAGFSYCAAYADLEAALAFIEGRGYPGKVIVWGSSYSASLAMRLAVVHPDRIRSVLAFSPASGQPMAGCEPEPLVPRLNIPVLVLRPAQEVQYEHVATQLEHFQEQGLQTYVAPSGVHGSSMLNEQRVLGDVEPTWDVVFSFIERSMAGDLEGFWEPDSFQ